MIGIHYNLSFNKTEYAKGWKSLDTLSMMEIQKAIITNVWSPIIFKDGYRNKSNFLKSDFLALDIDDGLPLSHAEDVFEKYTYIIGLTKSHQKEKMSGKSMKPKCDRFRIVIPWHRRIENLDEYEYNMDLITQKIPADRQAKDGARFFFPCKEIYYINYGSCYPVADVYQSDWFERSRLRAQESIEQSNRDLMKFKELGILPKFITDFKYYGKVVKESRQYTCWFASIKLLQFGWKGEDIYNYLSTANFDRNDFKLSEISQAITSAINTLKRTSHDRPTETKPSARIFTDTKAIR
jgi:hypothetical protein